MKIIHFTTDRRQGHVRAPGALARLLKARRLPPIPAVAEQVHGPKVVWIPSLTQETKYRSADGLLTQAASQPLAIFTADCVPIFLSVPSHHTVGLLHAGWRGVKGEILKKAVRSIRHRLGCSARSVFIWTGPAIGPCCFEVKWDVARYFPGSRRRQGFGGRARRHMRHRDGPAHRRLSYGGLARRSLGEGGWSIDLVSEIKRQARRLGVRFLFKPGGKTCTMHDRRFYSFRRDATMNRQVSVILQRNP